MRQACHLIIGDLTLNPPHLPGSSGLSFTTSPSACPTASILSKKVVESLSALLMDVKFGRSCTLPQTGRGQGAGRSAGEQQCQKYPVRPLC